MAGGLGWGIRGQYGHETGAMIAGLLVGLVLALLFCPGADPLRAVRAVAWGTLAMGIGGTMTYGQTIGLTQDAPLIGNVPALSWGMLGLAIKGAVWIGFAGALLGMGLSGVQYRAGELAMLFLAMLAMCAAGVWLFNEPYDPANRVLPPVYFSADWRWMPEAALKPRREVWGGLLFALATLLGYLHWGRRDLLAVRLAAWGVAGGAMGFPVGQTVQAFAAWNREWLQPGWFGKVFPLINWWNFMETVFGAVMGAALGLGLWRNRRRVGLPAASGAPGNGLEISGEKPLGPVMEYSLLAIHIGLLVGVDFAAIGWVDRVYDFGLMLVFIPVVAVAGGTRWSYWVILPLVTLPIAGKTVVELVYRNSVVGAVFGWLVYLVLPLLVTGLASAWFSRPDWRCRPARDIVRPSLLLMTWLFFGINFAVFRFPWPWAEWTARTPNALVFMVCAVGLTWLVAGTKSLPARAVKGRQFETCLP
jgi:hypothetical protein